MTTHYNIEFGFLHFEPSNTDYVVWRTTLNGKVLGGCIAAPDKSKFHLVKKVIHIHLDALGVPTERTMVLVEQVTPTFMI
jgi:hypothetical protein